MSFIGKILKKGIVMRQSLDQKYSHPFDLQKNELKKLLIAAKNTEFGKEYNFDVILNSFRFREQKPFYQAFRYGVPVHDYDLMFSNWWHKARFGNKNVFWPGKVKYFAMSSGTSGDSSKYIPVTKDMLKAIRRTGMRQLLTLVNYDLPAQVYNKGSLMLGGSTDLRKAADHYDGDLSGITTRNIPFWFQRFYKPGKKISDIKVWGNKLDEITRNAKNWDIGYIVGVPAWIQLLMEKIIQYYEVDHIHDIWPNLAVFVHGGVSFEPYQQEFEKLLGKPIHYIETYLASEGFMAFQAEPNASSMRLVLNNGIFFEFVPFDSRNFDAEGKIHEFPETYLIDEVEEGKEYALLISTCAGAWRYLIGDVVKIINKEHAEITITGRTSHFLNLCGEHLSVANMNRAIGMVENELNIGIREFTVTGVPYCGTFAHHWYIGCDHEVDQQTVKVALDASLKKINDDYKTERSYALKEVFVDIVPSELFYNYMRKNGKEGAQNKFPRVLKGEKLQGWEEYLSSAYYI